MTQKLLIQRDSLFLSYLGGYFDAKGYINISNTGSLTVTIYGDFTVLNEIMCVFGNIGIISTDLGTFWRITGKDSLKLLELISPFLIIKKEKVLKTINYLKLSFKNESEMETLKKILKKSCSNDSLNFFEYVNENWFNIYLAGFFDAKSKWKIREKTKKSLSEYWLEISVDSSYEDLLIIFNEISGLGYVIPSRSGFKWILLENESFEIMNLLYPFILNKNKSLKFSEKFQKIMEQNNLTQKDFETIIQLQNKLRYAFKPEGGNVSKVRLVVSINFCDALFDDLNRKSNEMSLSRNVLIIKSITNFLKQYKESDMVEKSCFKKRKYNNVAIIINRDLVDQMDEAINFYDDKLSRSEFIRKSVEVFLEKNEFKEFDVSDPTDRIDTRSNPLKLIKKLR